MKSTRKLKEFFDAVWSDAAGVRIVSTKTTSGKWSDVVHTTNNAAIQYLESAIESDAECFFGVHHFEGKDRKAENAIGCKAFYLDLDVKADKANTYRTPEEALTGLQGFLSKTGLPEPTIVASGFGFHVYWFLTEMLDESDWLLCARRLRERCKEQGLKADNITADQARVLRVPESYNYKTPDDPRKCEVLTQIKTYTIDEIRSVLFKANPILPTNNAPTTQSDAFLGGIEKATCFDPKEAREIAGLCVPFLNLERCDDYSGWLNVGIALHNIFEGDELGLSLWDEWSRQSKEYKAKSCDEKWRGFGERTDGERLTAGSLVHWATEDSETFTEAWDNFTTARRIDKLTERSSQIQNTDYGNAQRLVALFGDDLRYDDAHGTWYVYNGRLWQENGGAKVMQYAKATSKAIYEEAAKTQDDTRRQSLGKHAVRTESANSLKAMVKLAESEAEIQIDLDDFNTHPHLLNVQNGVIDLRTGRLLPHSRDLMLSNMLPVDYKPNAQCPIFNRFLGRIFAGNISLTDYLRRAIGYTITGENKKQVLFICHGDGANGKSTLLETIHFLLGDLGGTIRTEALMKHRFTSQSGHNDDVACEAMLH